MVTSIGRYLRTGVAKQHWDSDHSVDLELKNNSRLITLKRVDGGIIKSAIVTARRGEP